MGHIAEEKKVFSRFRFFKKPAGKLFWAWVLYQAVKGTLTLSFIWAPLIYLWWVS